jgi:ribonuclease P protein component
VLASSHRITRGDDYRRVVRRGKRRAAANTVTYITMNPNGGLPRFGFIVAKNVGNAVHRNRVRRRLKAAAYALVPTVAEGTDVVVRALPQASDASFSDLSAELARAMAPKDAR